MKLIIILTALTIIFFSCKIDNKKNEKDNIICFSKMKIVTPSAKEYSGRFQEFDIPNSKHLLSECLENYSLRYNSALSDSINISVLNIEKSNFWVFRFEWNDIVENVRMKGVNDIFGYTESVEKGRLSVFFNYKGSEDVLRRMIFMIKSDAIFVYSYEFYFPDELRLVDPFDL